MREAAVKRLRGHRSTACASGRSAAELHREIRRKVVERAKAGKSRRIFIRHFLEEAEGAREREMKTVVLSDHGADQLHAREAAREEQYTLELKEYTSRIEMRQARIDALKAEKAFAWAKKRYLRAVWYTLSVLRERCHKHGDERKRPIKAQAGVEDIILHNGHEGERRVEEYLGSRLDDRWILLCGYKNAKGEIDRILVGPDGLFAMEIKNYRGTISCNGDEWRRDKYDRWGNLVRRNEPIEDRGHRGPSRQVNEPANLLETFLARTLPGSKICRCVVFSDDDAQFADISGVTVDGVYLLKSFDLQDMLRKSVFRPDAVDKLARQIEKDHRFWAGRHRRRAPDPDTGFDPELAPTP